jgi:hypothetical protein
MAPVGLAKGPISSKPESVVEKGSACTGKAEATSVQTATLRIM